MRLRPRTAIAAALLLFTTSLAAPSFAQGQPEHDHSHGQGSVPAQPAPGAPPAQGAQGGMMGGPGGQMGSQMGCPMMANMMGGQAGMTGGGMMGQQGAAPGGQPDMRQMMPMMQNMMAMMSAQTGMMAAHVEGRIAALKTELKITEAQTPQWNRFADALRATAKSMNEMHQSMIMMKQGQAAKPLPERLAARQQAMSAHLASLKAEGEALQPLYASFSDEQKKIADGLRIGPMGMM